MKLPREGRKEVLREERKEASWGREEGSFQGKGGRKLPREGRNEVSKERKEGSSQGKGGGMKLPREESSRERTQVSELRRESSKERELKREN